jgi:hypothetical protein
MTLAPFCCVCGDAVGVNCEFCCHRHSAVDDLLQQAILKLHLSRGCPECLSDEEVQVLSELVGPIDAIVLVVSA